MYCQLGTVIASKVCGQIIGTDAASARKQGCASHLANSKHAREPEACFEWPRSPSWQIRAPVHNQRDGTLLPGFTSHCNTHSPDYIPLTHCLSILFPSFASTSDNHGPGSGVPPSSVNDSSICMKVDLIWLKEMKEDNVITSQLNEERQ